LGGEILISGMAWIYEAGVGWDGWAWWFSSWLGGSVQFHSRVYTAIGHRFNHFFCLGAKKKRPKIQKPRVVLF
jgi:hypothetical protein